MSLGAGNLQGVRAEICQLPCEELGVYSDLYWKAKFHCKCSTCRSGSLGNIHSHGEEFLSSCAGNSSVCFWRDMGICLQPHIWSVLQLLPARGVWMCHGGRPKAVMPVSTGHLFCCYSWPPVEVGSASSDLHSHQPPLVC